MKPITLALFLAMLSSFLARPSEAQEAIGATAVFVWEAVTTDVTGAPETIGATAVFVWEAVTTDVTGAPETIASYEVAAFAAGTVLNPTTGAAPVPIAKFSVAASATTCAASSLLGTVAQGTRVLVSVRCYDVAGNVSEWADPLDLVIDRQRPAKPKKPWWRFW